MFDRRMNESSTGLFTITCTITPAVNLPVSGFAHRFRPNRAYIIIYVQSTCSSTKPATATGTGTGTGTHIRLQSVQGPSLSLRRTRS